MSIDFTFTPEQRELQLWARDFAKRHLRDVAETTRGLPTAEERFRATRPVYETMIAEGALRRLLPVPAGGGGTGVMDFAIVAEEFIAADASVPLTLFANVLGLTPLLVAGSPEQVQRHLPPFLGTEGAPMAAFGFSEPGGSANFAADPPAEGTRTTAVLEGDEWVITGAKQWVSNAAGWDGTGADLTALVCRTEPDAPGDTGLSVLLVEKAQLATGGFSVLGSLDTAGHRAHLSPRLRYDGVRVPAANLLGERGQGRFLAEAAFTGTAAVVGAFAVGIMRRAFEVALDFTRTQRRGGGVPIIEHQAVGYLLADVKARMEAVRFLTWKACHALDTQSPGGFEAALEAKVFGSETAVQVIYDLIRVVGIESYSHELPLAGLLQDALAYPLFDGGNMGVRRRQLHALLADPAYDPMAVAEGRPAA